MIYKLKNILSGIEHFFQGCYHTLFSIIKVIILSKFNVKIPHTENEICAVLGNGPSLKNAFIDSEEFIKSSDLIVVNHFAVSKEYVLLKPRNYVLLDPNFFSGEGHLSDPNVNVTIENLVKDTTWEMNLFVPQLAKKAPLLKEILKANSRIKIIFYNYTIVKGFQFLAFFFFKRNLGMPMCQNVLGACIFLALNMGYKKIYLFGADHSWTRQLEVDEDNDLYMSHIHFYSGNEKPLIVKIYKTPERKEKMRISEYFMACVKTFEVYYVLNDDARQLHAKIINATPKSLIDAFERSKP
jgi:hypothetical protein